MSPVQETSATEVVSAFVALINLLANLDAQLANTWALLGWYDCGARIWHPHCAASAASAADEAPAQSTRDSATNTEEEVCPVPPLNCVTPSATAAAAAYVQGAEEQDGAGDAAAEATDPWITDDPWSSKPDSAHIKASPKNKARPQRRRSYRKQRWRRDSWCEWGGKCDRWYAYGEKGVYKHSAWSSGAWQPVCRNADGCKAAPPKSQ